MTLRAKTLLIIGVTLVGLVAIIYLINRSIVSERFADIEADEVMSNIQQAVGAVEGELDALKTLASDYAGWNDTYDFVENLNEEYRSSNLIDSTFRDTAINFMLFVDRDGVVQFGKLFDLEADTEIPLPAPLEQVATFFPQLLAHPNDGEFSINGVVLVDDMPTFASSHPILRSDKTGPRRGSLIMGRFLDERLREAISTKVGLSLQVNPIDADDLPPAWEAAKSALVGGVAGHVVPVNERAIAGYAIIDDPSGTPELLLRIERPREIYEQGQRTLAYFLLSLVISGLGFGGATLFLLEHIVLRRISGLADAVRDIGQEGDLTARLPVLGRDEISKLGSSINDTFSALERSQGVLQYISQHARCVLWTATVTRRVDGYHWDLQMQDEDAAQRLLPLDVFPGGSYARAWTRGIHQDDFDSVEQSAVDAIESDKSSYRHEFRLKTKDGQDRWIQEEIDIEGTGPDRWRLVGVGTDISAYKDAEVGLQLVRDAALEVSRMKSDFLANMSHEIRTPMNGIAGTAELLRKTALTGEQREYLDMINTSTDSLLKVINDVLDFSKIEAGRLDLDLDDFSLRQCVGDAMTLLAVRGQEKALEIVSAVAPEVPDDLVGDAVRLRQILVNLVGNAIKFTPEGEVVARVESEAVDERKLYLHVSVSDSGIGIAPEKQDLIFHSFQQADSSTTRQFGGTGLGLAISSQLAQRMHGRMWVESAVGSGSTFHFTALVSRQANAPESPFAEPIAALRDLPALIVEDHIATRDALARQLRAWGMLVHTATDADTARRALETAGSGGNPVAITIVDTTAAEADGLELIARLAEDESIDGSFIALVTAQGRASAAAHCRRMKAGVVTKPIREGELRRELLSVLGLLSADEEALEQAMAGSGQRLRVLLAEDDAVNQRVTARMLERAGHEAVVVGDGLAALAALEREAFDVVLMDVQMPQLGGFETTGRIREREQTLDRHLPIIAMTAHALAGDRERCLDAGMDGYIAKPISLEVLRAEIDRLVPVSPDAPDYDSPFDRASALERLGGDHGLLDELIELFHQEYPRQRAALREALRADELILVQRTAHALRGALGNFGATRAVELATEVEVAAESSNGNGARDALSRLEREVDRLQSHLLRERPVS